MTLFVTEKLPTFNPGISTFKVGVIVLAVFEVVDVEVAVGSVFDRPAPEQVVVHSIEAEVVVQVQNPSSPTL
ncbi:hypothetical protein CO174_04875 [Candidatus Uhrbacteria bacterium CG_4_9_14_3_um_filter_50_9]|uniref:Uncharacterized protein n=1 Tax=Candidatus Uhrbacteria bacterium CG_4_9_14_3_um_filter_50_9 TaxID=1975035 RepID=A0A2M7XB83_9BACT|nr:MAG: hypothetical protein CO174_04875 [Candidatus Uhrbacteria bacterium CG_4_9_14_3_um_filter_50_9]